jgi:hypothetical protein
MRTPALDSGLATVDYFPAHFELHEDGSIQTIRVAQASGLSSSGVAPDETPEDNRDHTQRPSGVTPDVTGATPVPSQLIFRSESPFVRLYHGNCLELLDAISAKYPEGRFDAIFADPPT